MVAYACLCVCERERPTIFDAMRASFYDRLVFGLQKLHRNGKAKRQTAAVIALITHSLVCSAAISMGIEKFE